MRWIAIVAFVLLAGEADAGIDGYFGIGGGPGRVGGELASEVRGGSGVSFRFGFRKARFGVELEYRNGALDSMHDIESMLLVGYRPSVAFYPIVSRWVSASVHGGLGFATITGTRTMQVPCTPPEECTTKTVDDGVAFNGPSLDLGATLLLSTTQNNPRPTFFLDIGRSYARHRVDTATRTGHVDTITIGIACAFGD
jgi:hypothetical protein